MHISVRLADIFFMKREIDQLMQSGLPEKEALVYHAALTLGPATVLRIARLAGTERSTTYATIASLVRRGLMREEEVGLKTQYVAEHPDNLRVVMEQKMQDVSAVIPTLTELYTRSGKKHLVRVYEGLDALRQVSDEVQRTTRLGDIRYVIGGGTSWEDIDAAWHERYLKWRSRVRIDARLLFQDSKRARKHANLRSAPGQQVRILPIGTDLRGDIIITRDHVVIAKLSHPQRAIVIEDDDMHHMYLTLFGFLWNLGSQP